MIDNIPLRLGSEGIFYTKLIKVNDDEAALKLYAALCTLRQGIPFIYYGDEIGMQGFEDPFNRGFYDWDNANRRLMEYYRQFISLRNQSEALRKGSFMVTEATENVVVFVRETENEIYKVKITMGREPEKSSHGTVIDVRTPYGGVEVSVTFGKGER